MKNLLWTVLRVPAALAVILGGILAASAQDPQGIGIAQSAEEGFAACFSGSPETALNCARQKCRDGGGGTCMRVRWCYPSGHSGAMTYLANRELTQVVFLCGAPSEAALLRMLAGQCAALAEASECRLFAYWPPGGEETARTDLLGKNTAD